MQNKDYLAWLKFYTEFATKLLSCKNNRKDLIAKLQHIYQTIRIKFPKIEFDDNPRDIDPFTIFGFFNKGITDTNRIAILEGIADAFSIQAKTPERFDGIPVLNNLNATFYRFYGERGEQDIDNLWKVFEAAICFSDNTSSENRKVFVNAYNAVKDLKGNRWKLTMGLYWIRPFTFLNLDSRNRWFIENPENMPDNCIERIKGLDNIPDGEKYLEICELFRNTLQDGTYSYKNFPELSYCAWSLSEKVNRKNRAAEVRSKRGNVGAAIADEDVDSVHYWIYSPGDGAYKWDEFYNRGIMAIGWGEIGDLTAFSSKDEMKVKMKECIDPSFSYKNAAHATWQFAYEMKPGDIVFAKKGMHLLVGRGVVTSEYLFDSECEDEYKNIRKVNWSHKGEKQHPGQAVMKTLTDITAYTDYVESLNNLFASDTEDDAEERDTVHPEYGVEDFLREVYMDEREYRILTGLVENKKNVILQGAPGVGKTFVAKRLAYSMMGVKDKERVMMIQFHQSYSYEDFIMGYRPCEKGFERKTGAFYNFCKKAEIDSDNKYFFIIDEINRGNLSKIFGELFMLIENDKRGIELQLLYSDEKFSVPPNVYIIGMMNTADRSLAMLDYALRRRFAFYEMKPGFGSDGFMVYRMEMDNNKFDKLIYCVESLNTAISEDESLGEGFCIGHSFFCNMKNVDDQRLSYIVEYELIPLLKEYWFDEPVKVREWSENLRRAIK